MDSFDQFWFEYPRHTSKRIAQSAYQKSLDRGNKSEDILSGVMRFKAHLVEKPRDAEFIPHASTWLNQDRHLDEYELPKKITREERRTRMIESAAQEHATRQLEWERFKRSPQALQAVHEGWSWSAKVTIYDGKYVDPQVLKHAHERAEQTAISIRRGELLGKHKMYAEIALTMYHNLQVKEAETAEEINTSQAVNS